MDLNATEKKHPHAVATFITIIEASAVIPKAYHVARNWAKKYAINTKINGSITSPGNYEIIYCMSYNDLVNFYLGINSPMQ